MIQSNVRVNVRLKLQFHDWLRTTQVHAAAERESPVSPAMSSHPFSWATVVILPSCSLPDQAKQTLMVNTNLSLLILFLLDSHPTSCIVA